MLFVISSPGSEEDVTRRSERDPDRRIQKTRNLLREALVSLIHEKDYDAIPVREILDRANVGRSTFYMHFRDKDELLVHAIQDLLRPVPATELPPSAKRYERTIRFSLPIFEYVGRHHHNGLARIKGRGRAIVHEHLRKAVQQVIADDLGKDIPPRRKVPTVPPDLLVQHVASTFILVLNWWVDGRSARPPKDVNDLFRALIVPTLAATTGGA